MKNQNAPVIEQLESRILYSVVLLGTPILDVNIPVITTVLADINAPINVSLSPDVVIPIFGTTFVGTQIINAILPLSVQAPLGVDLIINGTEKRDIIKLSAGPNEGDVLVDQKSRHLHKTVLFHNVRSISVNSFGGSDAVKIGDNIMRNHVLVFPPRFIDVRVDAGSGRNRITGGSGNDTLISGSGNDTIIDLLGNNFVSAGDGHNRIHTGAGNDTIVTGHGKDKIKDDGGNNHIGPQN